VHAEMNDTVTGVARCPARDRLGARGPGDRLLRGPRRPRQV